MLMVVLSFPVDHRVSPVYCSRSATWKSAFTVIAGLSLYLAVKCTLIFCCAIGVSSIVIPVRLYLSAVASTCVFAHFTGTYGSPPEVQKNDLFGAGTSVHAPWLY